MSPKPWPKMANIPTQGNTEVAYTTKEELAQVRVDLDSLRNELRNGLSEKFSSEYDAVHNGWIRPKNHRGSPPHPPIKH